MTHVIQYGPAENRETYIHRLGRTGRAGKNGVGILVLGGKDEERTVIGRELKGLNVVVRSKDMRECAHLFVLTDHHSSCV